MNKTELLNFYKSLRPADMRSDADIFSALELTYQELVLNTEDLGFFFISETTIAFSNKEGSLPTNFYSPIEQNFNGYFDFWVLFNNQAYKIDYKQVDRQQNLSFSNQFFYIDYLNKKLKSTFDVEGNVSLKYVAEPVLPSSPSEEISGLPSAAHKAIAFKLAIDKAIIDEDDKAISRQSDYLARYNQIMEGLKRYSF